jgi:uncharacterized membrane protein
MDPSIIRPAQTGNPSPSDSIASQASSAEYRPPQILRSERTSHLRRSDGRQADGMTKALGWFSVGLGVAQLLAPRAFAKMTGVGNKPILIRAMGLREMTSGIGLLYDRHPQRWRWSRVVGDAMDLTVLGNAVQSSPRSERRRAAIASAAVAGVAVMDLVTTMQHGKSANEALHQTVDVEKCVTINRSPHECYQFWRNFQNFPRFMKHVESVQILDNSKSHWKATAPAGTNVEWDAELIIDEPDRLLAWQSYGDADIDNAGIVRFEQATGGRGTVVRVHMQYNPPGGHAGELIAKLFGEEPSQQIDQDLRRFKQLIETGEVPTTEGQPSGKRSAFVRWWLHKGVQQ